MKEYATRYERIYNMKERILFLFKCEDFVIQI